MDKALRIKGIDCFITDVNSVEEARCEACGAIMEVERNIDISRSFAEAMGEMKRPSDSFKCPESIHDWHKQLIALILERNKTKSAKLTALLQEEINEILATKKPTKVISWY